MNRFPEDYYVIAEKETSAVNYWYDSALCRLILLTGEVGQI